MKKMVMIFSAFLMMSAQANELSLEVKKIIFDEIVMDVYFEDDGYQRMPESISDLNFLVIDAKTIAVTGESYSAWDDKKINYDCTVKVLAEKIMSGKDVLVKCTSDNENWPNF